MYGSSGWSTFCLIQSGATFESTYSTSGGVRAENFASIAAVKSPEIGV